jgi:glycosyltransferase 2 family protein
MKKIIVLVVVFLAAAFVYLSLGEIESILQTLQKGNIWFILLAILIQGGWFVIDGLIYLSLYRTLGLDGTIQKMTLIAAAANFVNVIAPSAGMGGMAVFISHARRNRQSSGKVTVVSMLFILLDYMAFLCVLTLGLIVLFRRNDLSLSEITASLIMFAIATGLGVLLYLGSKSARALGNALAWLARLVNRLARPFLQRDYLSEARAHEFACEMAENLQSLPGRYHSLIRPLAYALANKALMMSILLVSFLGFEVPFSVGTIIGGYSIAYLFLIVSPTPSGIGIVEGIMPLALTSLRVPWSQAVVVTLAYRGITFWFPLGVGAISFRTLNRKA